MPRRCVAAGCNTKSGEGYSLHGFPLEQDLHAKWVQAVKRQRSNWDGPSKHSMLCSKHFEADCFVTEGMRYRDSIGLPTNKRLKAGTVYIYPPYSLLPSMALADQTALPRDEQQRSDNDRQ